MSLDESLDESREKISYSTNPFICNEILTSACLIFSQLSTTAMFQIV